MYHIFCCIIITAIYAYIGEYETAMIAFYALLGWVLVWMLEKQKRVK